MKRKFTDPYDATLAEIRGLAVGRCSQISDDSDIWCSLYMGYSPMEEQTKGRMRSLAQAEEMVRNLIKVGEPAVPAVAKAFRMQGVWREELLPFVLAFRKHPVMRQTLELVAKRTIDPLALEARRVLAGKKPSEKPW